MPKAVSARSLSALGSGSTLAPKSSRSYQDSDDEEDSSPAALQQREQERLAAINDIDWLYPQLKDHPPDTVRQFKEFMLAPADIRPIPTVEEALSAPGNAYFYGFYMSEADIRKFAIKHDQERRRSKRTTFEDMVFLTEFLTPLMDNKYVWLRQVVVGEDHKRRIRTMSEEVGETAWCLALCSNWEYRRGFDPTNREVRIIGRALKKMPHWWQGAREE
ncbi:hypothetical protein EIP91_001931 [Steccherinum ochraceum]|uniref:Uncharacterized protein n=1 Tax=Steccherinum ochraceum TaxID=92696 RepID=A0A4R0RTT2_9APHY|nr:hypothetical protein EIP91_001931 [Steccherinum ochraceum]